MERLAFSVIWVYAPSRNSHDKTLVVFIYFLVLNSSDFNCKVFFYFLALETDFYRTNLCQNIIIILFSLIIIF